MLGKKQTIIGTTTMASDEANAGEVTSAPSPGEIKEESSDLRINFMDHAYSRHFMKSLLSLRQRRQFTDVNLKAENLEIPCHKAILSAASPYFNAMFTSGLEEAESDAVELRSTDARTLSCIIDYIYSAEIQISTENVQDLVQTCDQFQFEGLKLACEKFMLQQVEPSNCIGFYKFAKLYSLKFLQKGARHTMLCRFKEVVASIEFRELSDCELIEYILDDLLDVNSEDSVFEAVVLWVKFDLEKRKTTFETVLPHVRLPFCTPAYLCHVVRSEPLMTSASCQMLLEEARMYIMLPDHKHEMSSPRTLPRNSFSVHHRLVVIGGLTKEDKENRYCWFLKEESNQWELLAQLPRPNWKFYSCCHLQGGVVLTGGYHGNVKKECWLFDTLEKKWRSLPPMSDSRCKHRAVVHGEYVYVIGGEDDLDQPLASVERLDFVARTWQKVPAMPKGVSDPLVTSFGRHIYVFGGIEKDDTTSTTTYVYDTVWGEWTSRAPMPAPCRLGAVATVNGKIYILGGYTKTSMVYDPAGDSWRTLTSPREKHGNAPVVVWRGRILVGGGDVDTHETTSVVEEYDTQSDSWSYWQLPLKEELSCHSMLNVNLAGI